jgi:phage replication initiation protein
LFGSYLVRFIDFRDRSSDSNATRRRRLSWWAEFLDGCAKAESYMQVPVISSARTEAWIEKQAAPSLAAVFANKGGDMDYLQELFTEGRKRWGEKHRLIADGLV